MAGFFTSFIGLVFLVLIILIIFATTTYNKLQKLAHDVREASSNISVSLRRRVDLINKLQEIAAAYGEHEKMTYITVTDMESNMGKLAIASKEADIAMSRVINVARNFPELKANETYQMLMQQIETVEEDLKKARERYNHTVNLYNTTRGGIPTVFVATNLGFHPAPYFDPETADGLNNIKNFATEDGELLKATLKKAGYQAIEGTKNIGKALEEKTKKVLNRLPNTTELNKISPFNQRDQKSISAEEKISNDTTTDNFQEPPQN
jgi:LemA protein